ncbi:sigma-70 family RNA polymerase sigma factor [Marinicrinis sediminis]|uniref:Sigma-70 family RNA polymerase sigma factor n=1 Tax=Marinicrinis sediminis TaxID=1652465 RepID=A0ABW5RDU0_9BACL
MENLIKSAQQGNRNDYLKLFKQYENDIYRIAFMYVKNQEDALDVVQETAYRSFKSITSLKEPKHFKTWLIKITISCSIDLLRQSKKVAPLIAETQKMVEQQKWIEEKDGRDIPRSLWLRDLIDTLNETEKSIILLRYYEDCTIKEIKGILNIPLGTVKTILYRALKRLRNQVKEEDMYEG